jgi:tight adherence protein B
MMISTAAAALAAIGVFLAALATRETLRSLGTRGLFVGERGRWRAVLRLAIEEGRVDRSFGSRRLLVGAVVTGGLVGMLLVGIFGALTGALIMPFAMRNVIRSRRRRYAARIDACSTDLALALASALAAGRSLRGALLTVGASIPEPLSGEIDRAVVEVTLGGNVRELLASLRRRTGSTRIEAISGAIELHRGSGGDLIKLMRELADAFRERDCALRDAHSASAQARFTAYVVAAMPVLVALILELAAPGAVSGTLSYLPTALMMTVAAALLGSGVVFARRLGNV